MRIGLDIAQQRLEWSELLARAQWADEAGFDGVWLFDHFRPMYGEGPGNCFEAWTTLAALGAATRRVRLGVLVTGMTYRHPSLLAAEAVTVDHLSGGRLELAVGAAWYEDEHRQLGIEFPSTGERVRRFEEYVEVLEHLLTGEEVSFAGEHFRLASAQLLPRPVQRPRPPLWIGAHGERMLSIVARHADVWHGFGGPEQVAANGARLNRAAERAGRDPRSILRASSLSLSEPWDRVRASVDAYAAAGVGYLVAGWPSEGRARLDEFVERVLPGIAAIDG